MVQAEMVQRKMEADWPEAKRRIRERWRLVLESDLEPCRHDIERLIRTITLESGDPRERVEHFLSEIAAEMTSRIGRTTEAVREGAYGAVGRAQRVSRRAARWSGRAIRARPAAALLMCLAAGTAFGYVLGSTLRK